VLRLRGGPDDGQVSPQLQPEWVSAPDPLSRPPKISAPCAGQIPAFREKWASLPEYVKEIKQGFSRWDNKQHR
jgi:hypothetical protein